MYRFWLAACVEAFLRGSNPVNQLFVARSGLMPHLLSEILDHGFKSAASLQINFDLLGELVKFNRGLLNQLDLLLEGPASDAFFEVCVQYFVEPCTVSIPCIYEVSAVLALLYIKLSSAYEAFM